MVEAGSPKGLPAPIRGSVSSNLVPPEARIATFDQDGTLLAKKDGWVVISMKNDWKRIFAFEP